MRLRSKRNWFRHEAVVGIETAVADSCKEDGSDDLLQRLIASQDATAEMVGKMAELLHRSGALSDDDILFLVGGGYEVVEEEEDGR